MNSDKFQTKFRQISQKTISSRAKMNHNKIGAHQATLKQRICVDIEEKQFIRANHHYHLQAKFHG
jgi:hypothetical protein